MLLRNIIEIILVLIIFISGVIIYLRSKQIIDDAESEISISEKKDIAEKIEDD